MSTSSWFVSSFINRAGESGISDFSVVINTEPFVRDSNFIRAGAAAAESMLSSVSGDLYVGLSGGQHSEYVIRRLASVDSSRVVPVVVSLPWNQPEVVEARRICSELSLDPWVVEYSDRSWLYNRLEQLSYGSGRVGYMQSVVLLVAESVESQGGKLVTGGGHHFNLGYEPGSAGVFSAFLPQFYFYEWDYYVNSRGHPGSFFTSSQQLFDSMLINTDLSLDVYSSQCFLYRHRYRPRIGVDQELFQQARSRWSWEVVRPRWRVEYSRAVIQGVLDQRAG